MRVLPANTSTTTINRRGQVIFLCNPTAGDSNPATSVSPIEQNMPVPRTDPHDRLNRKWATYAQGVRYLGDLPHESKEPMPSNWKLGNPIFEDPAFHQDDLEYPTEDDLNDPTWLRESRDNLVERIKLYRQALKYTGWVRTKQKEELVRWKHMDRFRDRLDDVLLMESRANQDAAALAVNQYKKTIIEKLDEIDRQLKHLNTTCKHIRTVLTPETLQKMEQVQKMAEECPENCSRNHLVAIYKEVATSIKESEQYKTLDKMKEEAEHDSFLLRGYISGGKSDKSILEMTERLYKKYEESSDLPIHAFADIQAVCYGYWTGFRDGVRIQRKNKKPKQYDYECEFWYGWKECEESATAQLSAQLNGLKPELVGPFNYQRGYHNATVYHERQKLQAQDPENPEKWLTDAMIMHHRKQAEMYGTMVADYHHAKEQKFINIPDFKPRTKTTLDDFGHPKEGRDYQHHSPEVLNGYFGRVCQNIGSEKDTFKPEPYYCTPGSLSELDNEIIHKGRNHEYDATTRYRNMNTPANRATGRGQDQPRSSQPQHPSASAQALPAAPSQQPPANRRANLQPPVSAHVPRAVPPKVEPTPSNQPAPVQLSSQTTPHPQAPTPNQNSAGGFSYSGGSINVSGQEQPQLQQEPQLQYAQQPPLQYPQEPQFQYTQQPQPQYLQPLQFQYQQQPQYLPQQGYQQYLPYGQDFNQSYGQNTNQNQTQSYSQNYGQSYDPSYDQSYNPSYGQNPEQGSSYGSGMGGSTGGGAGGGNPPIW
ncbi:hypothetical protein N0V83_004990 [Neocucurbitaria cava]|uniref:Uncharacterized protein n=1 Tax=Neocucurbitaria cava TaxID=798079 RepID=A0A9W8Y7R9_9PLEO|nr:hypothetical protein N0V83_004990 [Neocucurbitaria cava]